MSTAIMAFARGPSEAGDPTALVVRTFDDGERTVTHVRGGDEQLDITLALIARYIDSVGLDVAQQKAAAWLAGEGIDVAAWAAEIRDEWATGG